MDRSHGKLSASRWYVTDADLAVIHTKFSEAKEMVNNESFEEVHLLLKGKSGEELARHVVLAKVIPYVRSSLVFIKASESSPMFGFVASYEIEVSYNTVRGFLYALYSSHDVEFSKAQAFSSVPDKAVLQSKDGQIMKAPAVEQTLVLFGENVENLAGLKKDAVSV